ncbi:Zinc finger X-linked protein ZXDB [Frankliniella fusca]|uniref:Zinc finger X-linked protein ZXDB n=1 Tax=Frankliniella fusca TaxID=407009 RepID=A0AAE1HKI3_9NEOP|nr:Zinc finger X-linked protein ZXDB [Frankliniella fusca]KAK3922272.1 Zinc finger X-linked protein ZXDB [Frankliniella fusca]
MTQNQNKHAGQAYEARNMNMQVAHSQDHDYLGPQGNPHEVHAPVIQHHKYSNNPGAHHHDVAEPNINIDDQNLGGNSVNMDEPINAGRRPVVVRNIFGVNYSLEDIFGNEEVSLIPARHVSAESFDSEKMENENKLPTPVDDNFNPGHVLNAALNALMNANRRNDLFEKLSDRITFTLPHLTAAQRVRLEDLKHQYNNMEALLECKSERENEVYACIKCNKTIYGITALKYHGRCCVGFNTTPHWMRGKHIFFHRPSNKKPHPPLSGKPKCPLCRRVYPSAILLKAHMQTYGINFCPILGCGKKFATYSKHNIHLGLKHSLNIDFVLYKCPVCTKRFLTLERLTAHCIAHLKKKYHCPHSRCTEVFPSMKMMMTHLKSHHPYICEACKRVFDDILSYVCHRRSHTAFHCNFCKKKFVSFFHFKKHKRSCKSVKRDQSTFGLHTRCNEIYNSLIRGEPLENQHGIAAAECAVCFYLSNNPDSVIVGSCLNGQHSASAG